MRVGLILYGSLDTLSGGYLYDRMLVRTLEEAGHRVTLFSLPWRSYPRHLADNWRLDWRARLLAAPVDLWLQDELNHPSLFWFNRTLRKHRPTPIVSIVHHLRSSEAHPRPLPALYRRIERAYLASVDAFLVNSHTTLSTVLALAPTHRPAQVTYPAADHLPACPEIDAETIAARALCADRLRVLFVGNLIPRKGVHFLLDAMAMVGGEIELTVVGSLDLSNNYTNLLRRKVNALNLRPQVRFLGRVDDVTLVSLYRSHHVFAAPSYEGFGIAYLEAQRFGLPVIALTIGAAPEVVLDGRTGVLVKPGDSAAIAAAFQRLSSDRERLLGMSLAARLRYTLHPTWNESMNAAVRWLETIAMCAAHEGRS
ncbi:MAG: glycosyltransferase family 4 protein [Caldilinea sp.]|nr:glycosyltransferase family 4 protein [Caldilinea sp.]MDW8439153.1 glycosyltransferase family 4 protein [Caldilineaceae bacterium]